MCTRMQVAMETEALNPQELELDSCELPALGVLENELRTSGRAERALNN